MVCGATAIGAGLLGLSEVSPAVSWSLVGALLAVVTIAVVRRRPVAVVVAVVAGGAFLSGTTASDRDRPPPPVDGGSVVVQGVARTDSPLGSMRSGLVIAPSSRLAGERWIAWDGPLVMVRGTGFGVAAGEPVVVEGRMRPASFRVRAGWIAGTIDRVELTRLGPAPNPLMRLGNRLRERVLGGLAGATGSPAGVLVSGFLIGEVSGLPPADAEALRRAGLSHYVAVSGSNVALFLGAWWLVSGPLAWSPRRRAVTGLVGLAIFVVVTRWESSVLRAAMMASFVLGGRIAGWVIGPWPAIGWAVTGLVLAAGGLAGDVGFQLSVAATAGILLGIPLWRQRRPAWVWATLGATMSAQAAVAPILLVHFGTVPLLAPLTNLVAAPLVVAATALGGVGSVLGVGPLVGLATAVAGVVLAIARAATDLPQLTLGPTLALFIVGGIVWRWPGLRSVATLMAAATVVVALVPPRLPPGPTVSFLDVGQGDAALIRGSHGEVILIDGGPDAAVLRSHLRGVRHIDLLIITHLHADHTTGLIDLPVAVGRVWHPPQEGSGGAFDRVLGQQRGRGALVEVPAVGTEAHLGAFTVTVLGPVRRYASPNDGSVVVEVAAAGVTILFSGDIETIAQADLGPLPADVMKVPHQGAATTDLDWLAASIPSIAVISVGDNAFGHPSLEVIGVLEAGGAAVRRTDLEGTVTLRLDHLVALPSAR